MVNLNASASEISELGGILAIVFLAIFALVLVFLIVYLVGLAKLFKKAGKPGWAAIVPFYSQWVLVEIAGLEWWWVLLVCGSTVVSLVSDSLAFIGYIATIVGNFCCFYNIAKKMHKDTGVAILATIFGFIMVPIMGFSKSYQFDNSVEVSSMGPFGGKKEQQTQAQPQQQTTVTNPVGNTERVCANCGAKVSQDSRFCENCGAEMK